MNQIEAKKHIEVALMLELFEKLKEFGNNTHDCTKILHNELEKRGYNKISDQFE